MARELHITLTNEDKGYQFSEYTEPVDPDTTFGELYRMLQREYGRCQSSVYIDTNTGTKRTGWLFVSRQRYEDTNETYLRGCWATIFERTVAPIDLDA